MVHDLDAAALASALRRRARPGDARRPAVHVVECSEWQAACHARELEARWRVDAVPWSLERPGEPPPGLIVATYFHYNDIRRRWPHRLREVRFMTIGPDPALVRRLPKPAKAGEPVTVLVCERDEPTAQNIAADVSVMLPPGAYRVETLVTDRPGDVPDDGGVGPVLFSPRVWSDLDEPRRAHPRALEASYVLDAGEIESIGAELGWQPSGG